MLYAIAIVLLVFWLLGVVTAYTMGGFIHIFLIGALIIIMMQLLRGRRLL